MPSQTTSINCVFVLVPIVPNFLFQMEHPEDYQRIRGHLNTPGNIRLCEDVLYNETYMRNKTKVPGIGEQSEAHRILQIKKLSKRLPAFALYDCLLCLLYPDPDQVYGMVLELTY